MYCLNFLILILIWWCCVFCIDKLLNNSKALGPAFRTFISMVIILILAVLFAAVVIPGFYEYSGGPCPTANLDIFFVNENTIEFRHMGGDCLEFDGSYLRVFLYVNEKAYPLDASSLGTLEVGASKFLCLNEAGLPAMEFGAGDEVIIKVVDRNFGTLVSYRELDVPVHVTISS